MLSTRHLIYTISCKRYVHICITGLGNPEPYYSNTKHNAGLMILDSLKDKLLMKKEFKYSQINPNVKYCQQNNIIMIRSDGNYINLSGANVVPLWRKMAHDTVHIVIHDDLSLKLGKVQLRNPNMSLRGHNGLKDIVKHHGNGNFYRLSIGIGRPDSTNPNVVADYVLSKFTSDELNILKKECVPKCLGLINKFLNSTI